MTLTEAKRIADHAWDHEVDSLRIAHGRLKRTTTNGGVRNSERAQERLQRRLDTLEMEIRERAHFA